jgi:DNA-directed RNA polymerase specialized sigma24 family protein
VGPVIDDWCVVCNHKINADDPVDVEMYKLFGNRCRYCYRFMTAYSTEDKFAPFLRRVVPNIWYQYVREESLKLRLAHVLASL